MKGQPTTLQYTGSVIRYAITDGMIAACVARTWANSGVDYIQLRNKTVEAGQLAEMARKLLEEIETTHTKLLINGRADVAVATGAAGVHLTAHPDELTPDLVRQVFANADKSAPLISVSCHTLQEVERARNAKVDLILFGPVFEKQVDNTQVKAGVGLELLQQACLAAAHVKVLALGGVNAHNAQACIASGAAGIAGIRMFA